MPRLVIGMVVVVPMIGRRDIAGPSFRYVPHPEVAHLRGTTDRLRRGSDAPVGAGRTAAGWRPGMGSRRRPNHSLLIVPQTLTAAVLTFQSWSHPVDHMQTTGTELAPQTFVGSAAIGLHVTLIPWARPPTHHRAGFGDLVSRHPSMPIDCEEDRTSGRCWSGCCEKLWAEDSRFLLKREWVQQISKEGSRPLTLPQVGVFR